MLLFQTLFTSLTLLFIHSSSLHRFLFLHLPLCSSYLYFYLPFLYAYLPSLCSLYLSTHVVFTYIQLPAVRVCTCVVFTCVRFPYQPKRPPLPTTSTNPTPTTPLFITRGQGRQSVTWRGLPATRHAPLTCPPSSRPSIHLPSSHLAFPELPVLAPFSHAPLHTDVRIAEPPVLGLMKVTCYGGNGECCILLT